VWREFVLAMVLFALYLLIDQLGGSRRTHAAERHARWIMDAEQAMHLDVEQWFNNALVPHHTLTIAANYEYATTYVISALLMLVLAYWKTPAVYRLARNSFVILNLLAFACFILFPLMPPRMLQSGFVDTVEQGGTVGSWGSPLVSQANQLAAMPSLHIAWALWVSVMLARLSHARWLQVASAIHVAVTLVVVLSTANHYVLDAVGAAVLVGAAVVAAEAWTTEPGRLATADEFFLNVENGPHAQNVGGYVILGLRGETPPSWEQIRDLARDNLSRHPRFMSRLDFDGRHPRWVRVDDVDWDAHVTQIDLPPGSDHAAVDEAAARLHAERLPRDRPLWRIAIIHGLPRGQAAFVILLHHCMADGIGGIAQILALVRPTVELPTPDRRPPSRLQSGLAIAAGLGQLATDGTPAAVLDAGTGRITLSTVQLEFSEVRALARHHGSTVTQLVLALVGAAVATVDPELALRCKHRLRVSVPVMLGLPGAEDEGNSTAAVIIDTPLRAAPLDELLPEVISSSRALRSPTRALASRWVMSSALRIAPSAARRAFAHTVYGRKFFNAIVSNIPGPPGDSFTLADEDMAEVYPLLPPAPGAPVTIGALTWGRQFGIGITTDPDVVDARDVAERMRAIYCAALTDSSSAQDAPAV